jgi:signal transduction histidine kinase
MTARTRGVGRVQFTVRDTGPGIGESARDDLYQAFRPFQGRSGFHFSGTGLGLTIARKLVRAMDGELRFETQRNLGTRFYFTIPLLPVDPM